MGIDGLLNLLRPITENQHISTFKNQYIGIDILSWIYRGCYSCSYQLAQNIKSIDFLHYIFEMTDMLLYYNIKPIFVFDGRAVNGKAETLQKRRKFKEQNRIKGLQFLENNQQQEARKYFSRCITIDQRIISTTMNALKTKNIQFIVAPYEADSQLAKLRKLGIIQAVICEDSDLLVYGVNVILKLNQNGQCHYIDINKWTPYDADSTFLKAYLAFDHLNRIDAAVLAGSDYNVSIKGIGIKRAIKLITRQATLSNVINKLKFEKVYADKIPQNYEKTVQHTKLIFVLATVYNQNLKKLEELHPEFLNEIKPQQMNMEELRKITGEYYQFDENVVNGKINSKNLQTRELQILNFRTLIGVNKENLLIFQILYEKKKQEVQVARKRRNEEKNKIIEDDIDQMPEYKATKYTSQLNQKEKQQKKERRKQRGVELQSMMSLVGKLFEDCEENSSNEHKSQKVEQFASKQKQIIKQTKNKNQSLSQREQSSQNNNINVSFLDPFLKAKLQTKIKIPNQKILKEK